MNLKIDRKKLIEVILDWNDSRLDLFELSMPNENNEFNGVMRFFYQDETKRYQTKCVRVSSTTKTSELIEVLREKFFPADSSIKYGRFGLYEHHVNGTRRLTSEEHPLLVQLNWSKLDREGKFVLKLEAPGDKLSDHPSAGSTASSGRLKRRLTFKHEKSPSQNPPRTRERRHPLGCAAAVNWTKEKSSRSINGGGPDPAPTLSCLPGVMHKLHPQPVSCSSHGLHSSTKHGKHADSPPDSSFTRTISNPEAVMRRRRQQTLEAKLMEIVQQGGPDIGGTLKIYGGQICPDVPYKTLLLSANDTVADVIRQSLDKYGLEDADSDAYCLVMRVRAASEVTAGFPGTEKILRDTDCPLNYLFTSSTAEAGTVVTFELRLRPPHLLKKRPFSTSSSGSYWGLSESPSAGPQPTYPAVPTYPTGMSVSSPGGFSGTVFACLVELESGGFRQTEPGLQEFGKPTGTVYPLPIHKGQVWVGTATNPDISHPLLVSLPIPQWPGVEAFHLVIWRPTVPPGTSSIAGATDGGSKRCGWLACQPCSTLDISTGQNRFARVYVNNRLLAPSPGNYACTHWLSPGDVLYLGNSSRGLKIWPGSGAVLPGSRSSSIKATPPTLVQPSSSPRSRAHAAPSPVPQIAYPEVPKHQRLYNSDMTALANSNRVSPRSTEYDPNLWNAKASYASPVSFLSPLIQSPRPRVVGSSPKTSFHDSPIYSPTGSVSASSSSLSSNPISDTSSSLPNYTSDLISPRNQIPYISTAKSVVHTSSPHMPSRPIRDHASTISNAPTTCPAIPAPQSSTVCTTSPDGLSLSYGYPTVGSGASYQMRFSPPFNPIPECSKPSAYETSPVTVASKPTKVDSSTSPVHRVPQNPALAGIQPTDPVRSSSSSSCTPRSGVSAGHSGSGRSKSTPTISDRLPCQMAFAPASVNSLLDWIITDYLSSLGGYPCNRNSHLTSPAPDSPPPMGCPLGPAMTVYLMLRAICRQCDRWEMMESKHQLKEGPLKRGPRSSNVTGDSQPADNSSLTEDSNEVTIRKANLRMRQRSRRQREILSLLVAAVERLQSFETILIDWFGRMGLLSTENEECKTVVEGVEPNFPGVLKSTSAWLANSSQLLHLTTRDADLQKAFSATESMDDNQAVCSARESNSTEDEAAHSAWLLVHEQLADVVQAAFGCLAELCVSRLDQFGIPQLISTMTKAVESSARKKTIAASEQSSSPPAQVNGESSDTTVQDTADGEEEEEEDGLADWEQLDAAAFDKKDSVISLFSEIMNCLHMAFINPAFVVQLFARLLHRLNARLFNFLIGITDSSEAGVSSTTHVSSSWGVVLHRWIHGSICAWALSQGLSMAAECYLQRISQAADLMLADMTSVESLYNVAVDLIGLNSCQIRALLESFRCADSNRTESKPKEDSNPVNNNNSSTNIPQQWIDFIVSGVKEVADRILAEEEASHSAESGTNSTEDTTWSPDLAEPLDLLLPFLLPEDSYPSDNPVPLECCDDPVSCDSGVSSRTSSTKEKDDVQTFENNKDHTDALITVDSMKSFLERAVKAGWCRLSVRPICVPHNADVAQGLDHKPNGSSSCPFLTWNVYLSKTTDSQSSPLSAEENVKSSAPTDSVSKPNGETGKSEQNGGSDEHLPQNKEERVQHSSLTITNHSVESSDQKSSESGCSVASSSSSTAPPVNPKSPTVTKSDIHSAVYPDFCDEHRPFTVVVPKVGRSLGLSIIAARSEEGKNLGIYIRSVIPGSGASRARLCSAESGPMTNSTQSLLQPGDHLLAVNEHSTFELSYEAASQFVASAGDEVRLTVVRNVAFRSAICGLNGNSASTIVTGSLDSDQPSQRSRICPECRLCDSLVVKSITLHAGDDGPLVSNSEEHPNSRQQVFLTNLHSLSEEDPPPEPSALGPVMHLPAKESRHFGFSPREPTNAPGPTTRFVPLVRPCPLARTEDIVYPLVVDTEIRRPSLPYATSSSCRFLSPEPVTRTARPLPTQVKRCSSSAGALHRGCNTLPCYSHSRAERHSHEGSSDPGEPTASECSLGSSTGPSFRLFSPQSLNRVKSHAATPEDWHFRSDDLPSDRPCHRPRGQSSSFDDWVSVSQVNILCERLTNGLVSSTDTNSRDSGQSNSLRRITGRNDSVEVNAHRPANFASRAASRPELNNAKSAEPTSTSTSAFSYFVNSSKPPSVFVPTAAFLPSDSSTMLNDSSSTDRPESAAGWTNDWRCGARASKSLTDLPSLNHKLSVHQSSVSPVTPLVRNRSGRPMQRRHTTLTTSRFNLGPRPEPPSQQSFHHSIATLNLRS